MNIKNVMFIAIFVPDVKNGSLENCNNKGGQHVTLAFKPTKEQCEELANYIGKQTEVKIVSYGNDGQNEGVGVEIDNSIPYFGAQQKHITLSIANGAKAVNTANLTMEKIEPFSVSGRIGYVDFSGIVY